MAHRHQLLNPDDHVKNSSQSGNSARQAKNNVHMDMGMDMEVEEVDIEADGSLSSSSLATLSIESMLAIPTEIIFRQIGGPNATTTTNLTTTKPLMTRPEAQCFLKVICIAQEMDALLHLAEQVLDQRRSCRNYKNTLESSASASASSSSSSSCPGMFKPLIILISILEQRTNPSLTEITHLFSQLMVDLATCCTTLRQSAEQNWTLAESLSDALDAIALDELTFATTTNTTSTSQLVAMEKRKLAELEEELCKRMERLLLPISNHTHNNHDNYHRGSDSDDALDCPPRKLFLTNEDQEEDDDQSSSSNQPNIPFREFCWTLFPDHLQDTSLATAARKGQSNVDGNSAMTRRDKEKNKDKHRLRTQPDSRHHGAAATVHETRTTNASHDYVHQADESQTSIVNKSNAAKALTSLAFAYS